MAAVCVGQPWPCCLHLISRGPFGPISLYDYDFSSRRRERETISFQFSVDLLELKEVWKLPNSFLFPHFPLTDLRADKICCRWRRAEPCGSYRCLSWLGKSLRDAWMEKQIMCCGDRGERGTDESRGDPNRMKLDCLCPRYFVCSWTLSLVLVPGAAEKLPAIALLKTCKCLLTPLCLTAPGPLPLLLETLSISHSSPNLPDVSSSWIGFSLSLN